MNLQEEKNNPAEYTDENGEEEYRSELSENMAALKNLPIFSGIPYEIIRLFAYTAVRKIFSAGDRVFRQGEMSEEAYLILSGKVRLYTETHQKSFPLQVLEAKDFFGYMALLAQYEWPLSCRVLEDTEILLLERESFRKILTKFPEKCILVAERLVQMRMKRMKEHMQVLMEEKESMEKIGNMF